MRQIGRYAGRNRVGAEFIDDGSLSFGLHDDGRGRCMCHNQLSATPLDLTDEFRATFKRIVGVKLIEGQGFWFVATLAVKPGAERGEKSFPTLPITAPDKADSPASRSPTPPAHNPLPAPSH